MGTESVFAPPMHSRSPCGGNIHNDWWATVCCVVSVEASSEGQCGERGSGTLPGRLGLSRIRIGLEAGGLFHPPPPPTRTHNYSHVNLRP